MVTCPRCAQPVDESTRSTCPHCFTPLPAPGAPQAGPPPSPAAQPLPGAQGQSPAYVPSRNPGARVSLTGEVIDQNAGSAPPPSYVGGGAPVRPGLGAPSHQARPPASRSTYASSRPAEKAKAGGGGIAAALVGLLVVVGLGAGGWWFLRPHTSPKVVVQQFDTALAAQDWKALYAVVEMPPETKSKYPDAAAFESSMTAQMKSAQLVPGMGAVIDSYFKAFQTAQVGEPTITGDSATVPVTLKLAIPAFGSAPEQTNTQQIPLRKINGAWKIDGLQGALNGSVGAGAAGSR